MQKGNGSLIRSLFFCLHYHCSLLLQPAIHVFPQESIKDRTQRDKNQHSRDSKHTSTHGYSRQNPDGRKTYGIPDHVGIDQIAFDLLKDQETMLERHYLTLGGMHPDFEGYREELRFLKAHGR